MIVVIEVATRTGDCASKEYDAPTLSAAMSTAERELKQYPKLRIIDVWIKGERGSEGAAAATW